MLSFRYRYLSHRRVEDKDDFYSSGLPICSKIRNLCTICQQVFITNSNQVDLYVLGDTKDISFMINILDAKGKRIVAQLYYIPNEYRLDLYDGDNSSYPIFVWKSKKCIQKNIPVCLETIGVEKMLQPLISIT